MRAKVHIFETVLLTQCEDKNSIVNTLVKKKERLEELYVREKQFSL